MFFFCLVLFPLSLICCLCIFIMGCQSWSAGWIGPLLWTALKYLSNYLKCTHIAVTQTMYPLLISKGLFLFTPP